MKRRTNLIIWEKGNGYKAKDVARTLGITEQTWCNIKNGKSTPDINFAYRFSAKYPEANVLELFKIIEKK